MIAAKTYNADGSVSGNVTTYADIGAKAPVVTCQPLAQGEENIFLINRNPDRSFAFLSKINDMIKSYLGMRCKYANVAAAVVRNVKTS